MNAPSFDFAVENYPLAGLTRYNVGGPAEIVLLPRTAEDVEAGYLWLIKQKRPYLVLGRGSNVLISDDGFAGAVLVTTGADRILPLGQDRYRVECGVELDRFVREVMVPANYAGVGSLTGIPGSVGGAVYMNAGTVNGTTCALVETVDVVSGQGRRTVAMDPARYSYRSQSFCPPGALILSAVFGFTHAKEDQRAVYDHYLARRKERQPQGYCCGSVFKNPPGDHAGRLIEACGLKGRRHGGAVISPTHANFIMNEDHASFHDILALISLCKETVQQRFGVLLEEEVVVVGG